MRTPRKGPVVSIEPWTEQAPSFGKMITFQVLCETDHGPRIGIQVSAKSEKWTNAVDKNLSGLEF